ncbi:MAG: xanthine dehydrogenase family protein molybdopterin-binding subunit, partial [Hyphomicrobiaceae bacterium]
MTDTLHATAGDATGIGAPVHRIEDARFLTGNGRFVDDIRIANAAHAYILRSPHGHARIRAIDAAPARSVAGVLAVLTAADAVADKLAPLPCRFFPPLPPGARSYRPAQPILVADKVRHVGDRVALVVAETLEAARDAAERIIVEYEPLAAAVLEDALSPGAPKVWDDATDNLGFQLEHGDRGAVDRQFAGAAHITRLSLRYPRAAASSIEPRAALAYRDPIDGRYALVTSTQAPYRIREIVATVLGISEQQLRVVAPDVGGAFGMKGQAYPEEALVVWAAGRLGRSVKWTGDRGESLSSDTHGRDQIVDAEIALDADGRLLAMRSSLTINLGAYLCYSGGVAPANAGTSYTSAYD